MSRAPRYSAFVVYRDKIREWRWRLVASNGRTISDSGEGYKRYSGVLQSIARLKAKVTAARVRFHFLSSGRLQKSPKIRLK